MFVAKNPYYALVAEDGTFTIEEIPAGKYTMKAWHGKLKNHPQVDVSIEAWKTTVVNLIWIIRNNRVFIWAGRGLHSKGIQDLSSKSTAQDKSCIPSLK